MTGSGGDKSQSSVVIMIGVVRQVGSSYRPPICLLNTCLVEDLDRRRRCLSAPPPRRPLCLAVVVRLSSRWTDPAPWLADTPYLSESLSEGSRLTHLHVWRGISALLPDLFALSVCHTRFVCFQHSRLLWFLLGCWSSLTNSTRECTFLLFGRSLSIIWRVYYLASCCF